MSARILFAAGGTGGHVYPALAVADAVRARDATARVHFVGGRHGIETELVPRAGYDLTRLPAAGLRGLGLVGALRFGLAFSLAFLAALYLVVRVRPDVVLATGGYASAAPAVAALTLGRPLWLQEQNSVPGSTNRWLSRFAERAYVAFEEAEAVFHRSATVVPLSNPVRADLMAQAGVAPTPEDYAAFELDPHRPTVLVFGGSRGAATLNRAIRGAWPTLLSTSQWQAVVQTGQQDWEATRVAMTTDGPGPSRARVLPYLEDMARAYRVADLVVCRAGAMTLAELEVVGLPAILVPFPHATDDHQSRNAQAVAARGAARVVRDADLSGEGLAALLVELEQTPAALEALRDAAAGPATGFDAAGELAAALLARAGGVF